MTVHYRTLKYLSFGSLLLIVVLLIAGSILEKFIGTDSVCRYIYTSPLALLLWGTLAVSALLYLLSTHVQRAGITFALHLSFLLILAGALTTHLFGRQGTIHLRQGDEPTRVYQLKEGGEAQLPFAVSLQEFHLQYYEGTFSPMDYISTLQLLEEGSEPCRATVSMNDICRFRHYRFYQSGFDKDGLGTLLSVSYDPYGIGVTYAGYLCLLLSMLFFFVQKQSQLRALLSHPLLRRTLPLLLLLLLSAPSRASQRPQTLPREVAEAFGNLYVYYNDRICPLQTLARDFTIKICGKSTYQGLTAEQVLTGWFFFYDDWKSEPMIRIKDSATRRLLGISGSRAALTDFVDVDGYKLEEALLHKENAGAATANEKFNLVSMVSTGSLFKLYPVHTSGDSTARWYSFTDKLPTTLSTDEWSFIRNSMNYVAEQIALGRHSSTITLLQKIKVYQEKKAVSLPSSARFQAEKVYNLTNINRPLAMTLVALGLLTFALYCRELMRNHAQKRRHQFLVFLLSLSTLYLIVHLSLRGYVSGHLPLSDGFETMVFMATCTSVLTLLFHHRFAMALPFGFLISGLSMMVAMIGESNPRITHLIPVLQSPLLSIHVVVIMIAYSLLAFAMLNGVTAVILHFSHGRNHEKIEYLSVISRILLYPAIFLLTTGIFVGAVWANVSWGRYWGWDPKEVWALITMLVYSLALHPSLSWFRRPMFLHVFCIVAFLTVLITYFGVNFLLGGRHSYA